MFFCFDVCRCTFSILLFKDPVLTIILFCVSVIVLVSPDSELEVSVVFQFCKACNTCTSWPKLALELFFIKT